MRLKFGLFFLLLASVSIGTALGLYISNLRGELIEITADNFDKMVITNDRPVLVAFTADW